MLHWRGFRCSRLATAVVRLENGARCTESVDKINIDYDVLAPSRIFLPQDLEGLPLPSDEKCDGNKLGHESIALVFRRWYIWRL
jgi:hypothetical protein